jgi:hypothetical protein
MASTMPTVQEVQERAREEQQPRENPENVGGVLGHDEEPGDDQEGEQHQTGTRSEPRARLRGLFSRHLILPSYMETMPSRPELLVVGSTALTSGPAAHRSGKARVVRVIGGDAAGPVSLGE